ncbi:MAG TPA: DUF2079 domain-containing protein [Gaiellaceae bacterium]|nr:DUF2079 domain-containing protein [Gaiellaceae bacterium]
MSRRAASAVSVGMHPAAAWRRRTRLAEVTAERIWPLAIWVAMAAWTVVLCVTVRGAYESFRLGRFDLGHMVQAVWSTAHGRPLEVTHSATGEQVLRLAGHVDPFLVLLTPIWVAWPSPLSLAFAQIAVVSLGALPVYWLGRRYLASRSAPGLLALAYLAYPWLAWSALGAIHPVTFAIPFYLFAFWFLDTGRLLPFALFAALAMSTGELMGLPILALGLWYAAARSRPRPGLLIAAAGLAWTLVAVYVVVPAAAGRESMFYGFYDQVGGSPQGVARRLLVDPGTVLGALVEAHDLAYLALLAAPLAGLFPLAPGVALAGAPQLVANLLSDFRSMTDPRYHSIAAVFPFLLLATVLGIARLRGFRQAPTAALVLLLCVATAVLLGPWARTIGKVPLGVERDRTPERVAALRQAIELVPDGVPVTASNSAGAHLSARRYVYVVPVLGRAEWAVVDLREPWAVRADSPILTKRPRAIRAVVSRLERDPRWRKVFERERVVVFRKSAP